MEAGTEGPARQAACLEGLRLLNLSLEYDQAAAEQLGAFSVRDRLAPLHQLLLAPQRRLAVLLQYVLYPDTEVQNEVGVALWVRATVDARPIPAVLPNNRKVHLPCALLLRLMQQDVQLVSLLSAKRSDQSTVLHFNGAGILLLAVISADG